MQLCVGKVPNINLGVDQGRGRWMQNPAIADRKTASEELTSISWSAEVENVYLPKKGQKVNSSKYEIQILSSWQKLCEGLTFIFRTSMFRES